MLCNLEINSTSIIKDIVDETKAFVVAPSIRVANAALVFFKEHFPAWDQICDARMCYCTCMGEK